MMIDLSGVALVTGASRGIGAGISTALGKSGVTVLGTATTEKGAAKITQTFKRQESKDEVIVSTFLIRMHVQVWLKR